MKYIETEIDINIRFGETDAMGVVWHGNYLNYFEDAREAFGKHFDLSYLDIYKNGFFIPVVNVNIDYKSPLFYGDQARVKARQVFTPAAKIVFEYEVFNVSKNKLSAAGSTTQIFMEEATHDLILNKPLFYKEWEARVGLGLV